MNLFDISESNASNIYNISNLLVILAAVFGLAGAIGIFWGGGVLARKSDEKIAEANATAAKANEGLANANLEIEERKKENLELSRDLESERANRLALEMNLKRRLPHPGEEVRKALSPFKPINVILESVRDPEAEQAARNLGMAVMYAGWELLEWWHRDEETPSGIAVRANEPDQHFFGGVEDPPDDGRSLAARDALVSWLERSDFEALGLPSFERLPPNTLHVIVGSSGRLEEPGDIRINYKDEDGENVETVWTRGPQDKPSNTEGDDAQ